MAVEITKDVATRPSKTIRIGGYTFASDLMVGRLNAHGYPWTRRTLCQYNVEQVLYARNSQHKTRDKMISEATKRTRWFEMKSAFHDLHDLGYKILYPTSIMRRHIIALTRYWEKSNLNEATVVQKVSKLNIFMSWIGKEEMIKSITPAERFEEPHKFKRQTATKIDKSLSADMDFEEIFERVSKIDKHVARQLKLSLLLGLRAKESWRFRPCIDYCSDTEIVFITRGTKGGHKRSFQLRNQEQRDYLKLLVSKSLSRNSSMMPRLASQVKWSRHYYYVLSKAGLNRKTNTNPHALRHSYAHSRYEAISSTPVPIKNITKAIEIDSDSIIAQRIAMDMVSQELGHQREEITSSYVGK